MATMHNPPHPSEVLKEYLDGIKITQAAKALNVTRANLSRLLNGHSGISPMMAIKLGKALNTSPEFWLNMQGQYDLYQASQQPCENIQPLYNVATA